MYHAKSLLQLAVGLFFFVPVGELHERCHQLKKRKKWKGMRDYYRSEFRKNAKREIRGQFKARPSSGNITVSEHRAEKRKADQSEVAEVSDNPDTPDSPNNEDDENNGTEGTQTENTPSVGERGVQCNTGQM
ncbi:hypothetical protein J6590_087492 [Homalodisca vitripennis]|nr:hypothetical protein J6590_087492 [Homalodisca vitripennis]